MKLWKQGKIWTLTLSLLLLASCSAGESNVSETPATTPDSSASQNDSTAPEPEVDTTEEETPLDRGDVEVSLVMLTGPTGMGAASLIGDNLEDKTRNPYNVTMLPANDQAVAMLASGEADIAALSTSVAATLYQKTDNVTVLAVNTLGVLYVMAKDDPSVVESIETMGDLSDKTIYTTGQGANPEYILNKLLVEAGVDPETGVDIQWMTADEVSATMISDGGIAMLPVPASTALMMKDAEVVEVIDVGAQWESTVSTGLPMGCVVVRTDFLEKHPEAVERFMADYEESIAIMADESKHEEVASLVVDAEISPSEAIALAALPKAGLVFVEGEDMKAMLESYYRVMFDADPASIGGELPYDDFYYSGS